MKRTHGKVACSFCGDKFRTMKSRFKHAKDCTEKPAEKRKQMKSY